MAKPKAHTALPSVEEIAARVAATDRRAEALGLDVRLAVTRSRGRRALAALLDGKDDDARWALAGLNAEQLRQIENAAVALSLYASRLAAAGGDLTAHRTVHLEDR